MSTFVEIWSGSNRCCNHVKKKDHNATRRATLWTNRRTRMCVFRLQLFSTSIVNSEEMCTGLYVFSYFANFNIHLPINRLTLRVAYDVSGLKWRKEGDIAVKVWSSALLCAVFIWRSRLKQLTCVDCPADLLMKAAFSVV